MFEGLSAFPLTPLAGDGIDEPAFAGLVERLVAAGVDSIGALGSTGSYAYLDRAQRARAAELAVRHAGDVPVIIGIGSTSTRAVLQHLTDAQHAGAAGVLLSVVTYQHLGDAEVLGLFEDVAGAASVPIVVYDNPGTTHITISDELHARIAGLPGIASIKIPPVSLDLAEATERVSRLRAVIPSTVSIGVSGDIAAATGMLAGCESWYSVLGGTLPEPCLAIARAAAAGDVAGALELSARLQPLWDLFPVYGSYRIASAIAQQLGLAGADNLPRPVRGLDATGLAAVSDALKRIA